MTNQKPHSINETKNKKFAKQGLLNEEFAQHVNTQLLKNNID